IAPRLRGRLGQQRRVIVTFADADVITAFTSSADAPTVSQVGPATPDHTIYTKRLPCFVPLSETPGGPEAVWTAVNAAITGFVTDYTAYFEAHHQPGAALADAMPRVVLV